ncbi:MAG: putative toxin-antitoxin system toxin component, PIN family [Gammaproteobacteria bacterium]
MSDTARRAIVIDTNIALDLLVFDDPVSEPLCQALRDGRLAWLASAAMREELRRVLAYPQIVHRLQSRARQADAVLARWEAWVQVVPDAPRAPYRCKDDDDQKFVDLAVAHRAGLLSKDKAILSMTRRLARLGVQVGQEMPPVDVPTVSTDHGLLPVTTP